MRKKGFTLVEILLVVFLGSILILSAYAVYSMSYLSYSKNAKKSELTQNARISLERMSRELRQSPEIITDLPLDQTEGTPPSEIKFQEGHDLFNVPPPSCQYQYITYQLSSGQLLKISSHYYYPAEPDVCVRFDPAQPMQLSQDSVVVKAEQISSLQFWGTNKLITTRIQVSDGTDNFQFETKTMARNV